MCRVQIPVASLHLKGASMLKSVWLLSEQKIIEILKFCKGSKITSPAVKYRPILKALECLNI